MPLMLPLWASLDGRFGLWARREALLSEVSRPENCGPDRDGNPGEDGERQDWRGKSREPSNWPVRVFGTDEAAEFDSSGHSSIMERVGEGGQKSRSPEVQTWNEYDCLLHTNRGGLG